MPRWRATRHAGAPRAPRCISARPPVPRPVRGCGPCARAAGRTRTFANAAGSEGGEGEVRGGDVLEAKPRVVTPAPPRGAERTGGESNPNAAWPFASPSPSLSPVPHEARPRPASAPAASHAASPITEATLGGLRSNGGAGPRRAGIGGYSPPKQVACLFTRRAAAALAPALERVRAPGDRLPTEAATEDYTIYCAFVAACKAGAQRGAAAVATGHARSPRANSHRGSERGDSASDGSASPEAPQSPPSCPAASSAPRWERGGPIAAEAPSTSSSSRHGRRALTKLNLYQFWANLLLMHPQLEGAFDEFVREALADAQTGKAQQAQRAQHGGLARQHILTSGSGDVRPDHGATWVIRFLYTACSRSSAGRDAFYAHFERLAVRLNDEFDLEYGLEKLWRFHRASGVTMEAVVVAGPDAATDGSMSSVGGDGGDASGLQRQARSAAPESVSTQCVSPRAAELLGALADRFAARQFDVAAPSMAMGGYPPPHAFAMAQMYAPHAYHLHPHHAHAMPLNPAYGGGTGGPMAHMQRTTAQRHFYVPGRGRVLSTGAMAGIDTHAAVAMQTAEAVRLSSSAPPQLSPMAEHAAHHAAHAHAHTQAYMQQQHSAALARQKHAGSCADGAAVHHETSAGMHAGTGRPTTVEATSGVGVKSSTATASTMPYVPPHMSATSVAMAAARANGGVPHAMPVYMPGSMGGSFLVPQYHHPSHNARP